MKIDDNQLEALLRARHVEPPLNAFAERILSAARHHKPATGLSGWLQELMADILLPKPALAAVLALGLVIGFVAVIPASVNTSGTTQTALYDEGMIL